MGRAGSLGVDGSGVSWHNILLANRTSLLIVEPILNTGKMEYMFTIELRNRLPWLHVLTAYSTPT